MEQDILEQLYFGRIVPWENRNDKTPEMEQCSEQVYRDTEHLKAIRSWRALRMGSGWGFSVRQQVLEIKISCKTHKFCPESLCNI